MTVRRRRPRSRARLRRSRARRTPTLKVSVGYLDGYIGEGQISYGGSGALARGRLALDIVRERLKLTGRCDDRSCASISSASTRCMAALRPR